MTDDELRTLVRDVIARRPRQETAADADPHVLRGHASHVMFPLARGGDGDGACLIEPSVRCTHCGYCLSYGH
jgi:hypothetical protein